MKMKKGLLAGIMALTAMLALPAHAGIESFDFKANDATYEVTGLFHTADTLNVVGGYDILGISGNVTGTGGGAITGLYANPAQPYPSNCCTANGWYITFDNVLDTLAPYLDMNGVAFTSGLNNWNLFYNLGSYELFTSTDVGVNTVDVRGTMTVNRVPEPGTLVLTGLALLLIAFVAKRRTGGTTNSSMAMT